MSRNTALENKHVVITGASSGIGRDMAVEVAKQGGIPILLARREELIAVLAAEIKSEFGINAFAFKLDVSDTQSVEKIFKEIYQIVGNVDVLINNAGFAKFVNSDVATNDEVRAMFDVNVLGLIACTNAVLPTMKANNQGQIINVASIIGKIPTPKASAYAATKHAVLGFTNALRMELMDTNVQITAINPGPVKTEFFELADATGNYTKNVKKMMLDSKMVARKTISTIGTKRRELNLPWWMGIGGKMYAIVPVVMERTLGKRMFMK